MNTSPRLQLSKDTLLLLPCSGTKQRVPCSGTKQPGRKPSNALSILSVLDPVLAAELANARDALREKARVDDETLMPAYLRYRGQPYKHSATYIGEAVAAGQRVLIVSGGYGLILADEPIGMYNKQFALSDWRPGLLKECILDYAHHEGIRSVIAVMSRTTGYAKLISRCVDWGGAGLEATLVSADAHGPGVRQKVLRAQGEAVAALINSGLDQDWLSSDSLPLKIDKFPREV